MGLLYTLEPYRYVPLVPLSSDPSLLSPYWIAASPHAFTGNQSHSNFFQLTQNFIQGPHCRYLDFMPIFANFGEICRIFFRSFSQRYASQFFSGTENRLTQIMPLILWHSMKILPISTA